MKYRVILLFLLVQQMLAVTITGYITDTADGEPLSFTNVILHPGDLGAATDVHGFYTIPDVPPGEYTIKVMIIGYETIEQTLRVGDENMRSNFEMTLKAIELEVISVSTERTRFDKKVEVSRVNLSPIEIRSAPTFGEADIFRTIQTLPSVVSPNDFSSALIVRGGSPDENLILLDRAQVFNPYHVGGVFSTFNTDIIANSEFMAGGYSAEFGGSLSSVLDITSREGNSKGGKFENPYFDITKAKGEVSMISAKLAMEGPMLNGSWMMSYRRTYFDKLADAYYFFTDTDPSWDYWFSDLQLKAQYNVNPNNKLILSLFSGHDDIWLDIGGKDETSESEEDSVDMPRINFGWDWGNRAQSIAWRWTPNQEYFIETMFSHSQYIFDIDFKVFITDEYADSTDETSTENIHFTSHNDVQNYSLRQDFTWIPSKVNTFRAGWELKNLDLFYQDVIADNEMIPLEHSPSIYSVYLKDTWRFTDLMTLDIALRTTKYEDVDDFYLEPRLGLKYTPHKDLALKASWGKYNQYLFTINQDEELLRMVDMWQPVPKGREPQQAEHFILGAEYWVTEGTKISLEYYWKPYLNIYDLSATYQRGDGYDAENELYTNGTGYSRGVELLLKRSKGRVTGWLGISSTSTKKIIDLNNDGVVDPDYEKYPSKYESPLSLNLVANYQHSKRDAFGVSITATSGQNYTPVTGKVYYQSIASYESMDNPYASMQTIPNRSRNSARYPMYFRLDASYSRNVKWFGINGKFKLQALNLTNHFNVLFYNWDHDTTPSHVSAYSMFPVIITMGWEFEI